MKRYFKHVETYIANFKPYFSMCNECLSLDREKLVLDLLMLPEGMPIPTAKELTALEISVADEDADTSVDADAMTSMQADDDQVIDNRNPPFPEFVKLIDMKFLKNLAKKTNRFITLADSLPNMVPLGLFGIDLVELRENFAPLPRDVQSFLSELLPKAAKLRCQSLLVGLNRILRRLSTPQNSIKDFVDFYIYVEEMGNYGLVSIEKVSRNLSNLYAIIEENKIPISPQDQALYGTVDSSFDQVRSSLVFCQTSMPATASRWTKVLSDQCANLDNEAKKLGQIMDDARFNKPNDNLEKTVEELKSYLDRAEKLLHDSKNFNEYEETLGVPITDWTHIYDKLELFRLKYNLWYSTLNWKQLTAVWNNQDFMEINVDEISRDVNTVSKVVFRAERGLPENSLVPALKQKIVSFKHTLPVITDLRNPDLKLKHFEEIEKLLGEKIPGLRKRLSEENPDEETPKGSSKPTAAASEEEEDEEDETNRFTYGWLIEHGALSHREAINSISVSSSGEASLRSMLDKIIQQWKVTSFEVLPHGSSRNLFILGSVEDVTTQLEDSIATVSTIRSSRHVTAIEELVDHWDKQLSLLSDTLDEWLNVQKSYLYLENIFSASDIQRQLVTESKMFQETDVFWRKLMLGVRDYPNALLAGTQPGLKPALIRHSENLDKIQKGLEDYLESKRVVFPRFYFLSSDELLEILSQTKNVEAVQPFLRKIFEGIFRLQFASDKITINAMRSAEGEIINYQKKAKARGNVENWLGQVETRMREALTHELAIAVTDYLERPKVEWVKTHPAQILLVVSQIHWAHAITECLSSQDEAEGELDDTTSMNPEMIPLEKLKLFAKEWKEGLSDLVSLVRTDLTKLQRKAITTLITIDVHSRDTLEQLIEAEVVNTSHFEWLKRLRYYWQPTEGICTIQQINASFPYRFEYLGASGCLVITPLTDRCYMTLTGALNLKLGGAPAGPAGTGKTETVKDLAKALGVQCVVFNCSEGLDYVMMGGFFSGLAQCGAMCCFDEFNRIDIEVLSVIAQQILTIKEAIVAGKERFLFEGKEIKLDSSIGIFITMNPGYAGRTELPDNLKALFRSVSMMVPDYSLIAEIILFSEGFDSAKELSRKMVHLYRLSSEQLSQQDHYDFGMRALKAVLVMAGSLKREYSNLNEDTVLIRAMRDSNVPKFLAEDIDLFMGIVQDLFPGVRIPPVTQETLKKTVGEILKKRDFEEIPNQILKIIQLYETMEVRHGVMLVGPTTGSKTVIRNVLAESLNMLSDKGSASYPNVRAYVLNPKCISMGELFGSFNDMTHEWKDGLVASIVRQIMKDTNIKLHHWVTFDGPVDTLWIENMNTVLDDNKTLCLANSERIKLNDRVHILFEVQDLAQASPATVSRCGMVYVDPETTNGWKPFVKTWCKYFVKEYNIPDEYHPLLLELFETYCEKGLHYVRKSGEIKEDIVSQDLGLVNTTARYFSATLVHNSALIRQEEVLVEKRKSEEADPDEAERIKPRELPLDFQFLHKIGLGEAIIQFFKQLFMFSFVWGIGGTSLAHSTEKFDDFAREVFGDSNEMPLFPPSGTVYDFFVDWTRLSLRQQEIKQQLADDPNAELKLSALSLTTFTPWSAIIKPFEYNPNIPFSQILVPTIDTMRTTCIVDSMISSQFPILLSGESGTGKTVIVQQLLNTLSDKNKVLPIPINFSAQTPSKRTQEMIEVKMETRRKKIMSPPVNQTAVIFVDNFNLPSPDEYGSQPPIELIRQLIDMKGLYDRNELFFKDFINTVVIGACGPPGGGRNEITPRLSRHFILLSIPEATDQILTTIFQSILDGAWEQEKFPDSVTSQSNKIVRATIALYREIAEQMRPTPSKIHYTFNLRDVSNVFSGLLMYRAKVLSSAEELYDSWAFETQRVFMDRLVNDTDKGVFIDIICDVAGANLSVNWRPHIKFGQEPPEGHEDEKPDPSAKPLLFADFMLPGVPVENREIQRVDSYKKLQNTLCDYLDEHNFSGNKKLDFVFFKDAMEHAIRISKILRTPRGNALLVGVGGSGKQSLARLCAFICEFKIFQIELTRNYRLQEFRNDLKEVLTVAGVEGQPIIFLFTENQIVDETQLEDINSILNTGEVPNLFENEEMDAIINNIRPKAKEAGISGGRDLLLQFFTSRVRDNLHIILCMSPANDSFRRRLRMFPSLITNMTIDWFQPWPEDALFNVAEKFLSPDEEDTSPCGEFTPAVVRFCMEMHRSVTEMSSKYLEETGRPYHITPTSYLELLRLFKHFLSIRKNELGEQATRLENGLYKLKETNEQVALLSKKLEELKPELEESAKKTDLLIVELKEEAAKVDALKKIAVREEAIFQAQAADTEAIAAEAQKDLDQALPALNAAVKAVNSLSKSDISEVKAFTNPPPLVQTVMEAVCILLGSDPSWASAKTLLSDASFVKKLIQYDKDNVPESIKKRLRKYIQEPEFKPENVARVSVAARSLCMWVIAIDVYAGVFKDVKPKRERLHAANKELAEKKKILAEKQAALREVEEKIAKVQERFDVEDGKRRELQEAMELTRVRFIRADQLTTGLKDEHKRWSSSLTETHEQEKTIVGDIILAAGIIAYLGAFTMKYRSALIKHWKDCMSVLNIPFNPDFSLTDSLISDTVMQNWHAKKLPPDPLSEENAIIATKGLRWPLFIDPQDQASAWIKALETPNGLKIIKPTDSDFLRTLEHAIRLGHPVLMENIGEMIDPSLDPVLTRQTTKQGGRLMLRLGDSDVEYNPEFRFYLVSRLSNPQWSPETQVKVSVINFTVTNDGLDDQLLSLVVQKERPDLEEKRTQLIQSMADDQSQLKDLENKILFELSSSKGNVLDNEVLIKTLTESKKTAETITERVKMSQKMEKEINLARSRYVPVASRGSVLFFCISDMSNADPMYQFSLDYFSQLFINVIDNTPKSDVLQQRIDMLMKVLVSSVFKNICRGLFEKDKLAFSFLISTRISQREGDITKDEWDLFIRGLASADSILSGVADEDENEKVSKEPPHTSFSKDGWKIIQALSYIGVAKLRMVAESITENPMEWVQWLKNPVPSTGSFACPTKGLSYFHQLIILRALYPQVLPDFIPFFVSETLGSEFIEPPPLDLAAALADSAPHIPLIFILSTGADPFEELQKLGKKEDQEIRTVSLGQGQGPVAESAMISATANGSWVFLQNAHLAASWMNRLEQLVESLSGSGPKRQLTVPPHKNFRLWLSSMPTPIFPPLVLRQAVKMTTQPPQGIKANLLRAFAQISEDDWDSSPQPIAFRRLLFSLSFFHSILQERKRFGPQGWNIPYDFSDSDFRVSVQTLQMFLEEPGYIPWDALRHVTAEIHYGGRVTDAWDRRLLHTLLDGYYKTISAENVEFLFSESGTYRAPDGNITFSEMLRVINALPPTETPEVFHMDPFAEITYKEQMAKSFMERLLVIALDPVEKKSDEAAEVPPEEEGNEAEGAPGEALEVLPLDEAEVATVSLPVLDISSDQTGQSQDAYVDHMANLLLERLPKQMSEEEEACETAFVTTESGLLSSLSVVLRQEIARFNNLLATIERTLKNLRLAIKGFVIMSADLESVFTALYVGKVPKMWEDAAYPSLKPLGSWFTDLQQRVSFLRKWLTEGLPKSFWISGFFFPQGFITGVLQTYSRRHRVPIDTLSFKFRITKVFEPEDLTEDSPDDGVFVHGIFIDAGCWDLKEDKLVRAGTQLTDRLPLLHFIPVPDFVRSEADYAAPLYKTGARAGTLSTTGHSTNHIMPIDLPTDMPVDFFIRQGTALLCQLNN
eukprot:gnl/Chilomastix_cuspidata/3528.p1 GENE.gnl/Chilomastix_cuspidata/3528~~gnl/Chilomastix_cuspidata/3528.p1  ORF type:complete len:4397 (+),score=382.77 gnl/Chilomastix_cuspidata/3528:1904-13192(+)